MDPIVLKWLLAGATLAVLLAIILLTWVMAAVAENTRALTRVFEELADNFNRILTLQKRLNKVVEEEAVRRGELDELRDRVFGE